MVNFQIIFQFNVRLTFSEQKITQILITCKIKKVVNILNTKMSPVVNHLALDFGSICVTLDLGAIQLVDSLYYIQIMNRGIVYDFIKYSCVTLSIVQLTTAIATIFQARSSINNVCLPAIMFVRFIVLPKLFLNNKIARWSVAKVTKASMNESIENHR